MTIQLELVRYQTESFAKLRVCASCEWIFKIKGKMGLCPKCGFATYGAKFVYGNKCYKYAKTQQPWIDGKVMEYTLKLMKEIENGLPKMS